MKLKSKKKKYSLNLNKITSNLVNTCNKVLTKREKHCQCFDTNNHPDNNISDCMKRNNNDYCRNYNRCKYLFTKFMSGNEPIYNPDNWSAPLIEKSHNCYAYFLDDKIKVVKDKCLNLCKKQGHDNSSCKTSKKSVNKCSNLKPQPGNYAHEHKVNNFKANRYYTCDHMKKKILIDSFNPRTKKSNIFETKFSRPCPKDHYKGGLTIQKGKTYHFYRQDKNGRYSHKQGTLRVENKDASGKPIWVPHLSDLDYNKENKKNGISYDEWCGYYCIPRNYHADTHALGGSRRKKKKSIKKSSYFF